MRLDVVEEQARSGQPNPTLQSENEEFVSESE
jgi:hypothetical protein